MLKLIYNIKTKDICDTFIKKAYKRKNEIISDEESDNNKDKNNNIIPSFDSINILVYKYISKNIDKLSELHDDIKII